MRRCFLKSLCPSPLQSPHASRSIQTLPLSTKRARSRGENRKLLEELGTQSKLAGGAELLVWSAEKSGHAERGWGFGKRFCQVSVFEDASLSVQTLSLTGQSHATASNTYTLHYAHSHTMRPLLLTESLLKR